MNQPEISFCWRIGENDSTWRDGIKFRFFEREKRLDLDYQTTKKIYGFMENPETSLNQPILF